MSRSAQASIALENGALAWLLVWIVSRPSKDGAGPGKWLPTAVYIHLPWCLRAVLIVTLTRIKKHQIVTLMLL